MSCVHLNFLKKRRLHHLSTPTIIILSILGFIIPIGATMMDLTEIFNKVLIPIPNIIFIKPFTKELQNRLLYLIIKMTKRIINPNFTAIKALSKVLKFI